ncbi:uncharacterized protein LOC115921681 [Strongylocentrotus purpuratus]|uniref:DUF7153 domain-containing protein n=1 Tax=Strongylocentrotus purpuratus TaxID=7668 RepID=A0A7M7NEB4_STRPU|nr:uncharacterized protein LOC115921681 [Strongylocentrotus purpuratus]
MAGNDELHIVFNFFEKVSKPPEHDSHEDGMKFIYEWVRKQPSFVLGQIHKNLDQSSGSYKYVNYVGFNNGDFHAFRQGPPPPEWIEVGTKGLGGRELRVCYPGGYAEVATTSVEPMCTTRAKDQEKSYYLLVNYKDSDIDEASYSAFEAEWKVKTGADIVSDAFPADIKRGDIALYKRRRPGRTPFVYVLRVEILPGASTENVLQLLPILREKLTAGGIPFSDVGAYSICYLCDPVKC